MPIRILNIEPGRPTREQALLRLAEGLANAQKGGVRVLKVIHGYGSTGQGGVLLFEGLLNVGRIQLTLNASDLAPNGQASDFILFNVGTPVPEPSTLLLLIASIAGFLVVAKRRQGWAASKGCCTSSLMP